MTLSNKIINLLILIILSISITYLIIGKYTIIKFKQKQQLTNMLEKEIINKTYIKEKLLFKIKTLKIKQNKTLINHNIIKKYNKTTSLFHKIS